MKDIMDEKEQCEIISEATDIAIKYGTRSKELKKFMRPYLDTEVAELVATAIFLMENPEIMGEE
jgi:hypothetical protein